MSAASSSCSGSPRWGPGAALSKPHTAVLTFGQTHAQDFPLMMIGGREPNSPEGTVRGHGNYDFRKKELRFRAFRNTTYGVAAATIGLIVAALKVLCVDRDASVFVNADALPSTILGEVNNKRPEAERALQ